MKTRLLKKIRSQIVSVTTTYVNLKSIKERPDGSRYYVEKDVSDGYLYDHLKVFNIGGEEFYMKTEYKYFPYDSNFLETNTFWERDEKGWFTFYDNVIPRIIGNKLFDKLQNKRRENDKKRLLKNPYKVNVVKI